MDSKMMVELFGYLGSILVVVSMLMTSVKKLRIVNTTGSMIFAIYALIIHSYPTALMNFCLVCINIYQLVQLGKKNKHFKLVKANSYMGAPEYLMEFFCEDIKSFFPDFVKEEASNYDTCYMVFCDANPAGILLGNLMDSGRTVNIYVDYALPTYRDCSVGEFLYKELKNTSIKKLIFSGTRTPIHEEYLSKMGFKVTGEGYEKEI